MKIFSKTLTLLILILLLALILRSFTLTNLSLYGDELTIVYDGYSILKTGQDQTGKNFPLTFPMGAGRPGGYIYASVPFIALFGPTSLGVRFVSLLSGIGIVLMMFLLGKRLFSEKLGLVVAFLTAISMWDISLSSGGYEAHFALFLALFTIYGILKSLSNPIYLVISALTFGLTINTYPTFKLTLPLMILTTIFYLGKKYRELLFEYKWYSLASMFMVSIFAVIAISQTLYSGSESRFSDINFLSQEEIRHEVTKKVNLERNTDTSLGALSPLFHNKWIEYTSIYSNSYLKSFSPEFLFVSGDGNPRHNMSGFGAFYYIEMILFFVGIYFLTKNNQSRKLMLLLSWLFIVPLATAFLVTPHFLRNGFMIVPFLLITANGLFYLWSLKGRFILLVRVLIIIGFASQFILFADRFYLLSPQLYSNFWSSDAKEASHKAALSKDDYDIIFLSNNIDNIEYAYPVYNKIDPNVVISQNKSKNKDSKILKTFDNVYIGDKTPDELRKEFDNKRILFIEVSNNPQNYGDLIDRDL